MARGTVVGEPVVSQANTEAFEEGYSRTFGDRKPVRGRWIWDEDRGELVPADSYVPPSRAVDAPIIADRIHEGTVSPIDGSDIGSRAKRREHNRRHGVTDASDFSPGWYEGTRKSQRREADKVRREAVARAAYQILEKGTKHPRRPTE
jgi:hypothetical protein